MVNCGRYPPLIYWPFCTTQMVADTLATWRMSRTIGDGPAGGDRGPDGPVEAEIEPDRGSCRETDRNCDDRATAAIRQ